MIFSYLPWLSPCFSSKCPNCPPGCDPKDLYRPENIIGNDESSGNCYAKAFHTEGPDLADRCLEMVRKEFLGWKRWAVAAIYPCCFMIYIMIYIYIWDYTNLYIYIHLDLRKDTNNCPFARFLPLGRISCKGAGNGHFLTTVVNFGFRTFWADIALLCENVSIFLGGNSREKGGNTRADSSWLKNENMKW